MGLTTRIQEHKWCIFRRFVTRATQGASTRCLDVSITLALSVAFVAHAQTVVPAERPELEVGDSWTYDRTELPSKETLRYTLRVQELMGDRVVVGRGNSRWTFTRDWGYESAKRGNQITWSAKPPLPLMSFPLHVGKQWNGDLTGIDEKGHAQYWRGKGWVEKTEQVTVPAGTFQTYLIRYEGYYNYNTMNWAGNVRWLESLWYAPEARRWVKRDWTWQTVFSSERKLEELVSFTRSGKSPAQASQTQRLAE